MTVFVMDEQTAEQLREIARYADEHRVPLIEMKKRHAAWTQYQIAPEPFGPEHTLVLPFGFRVVFTIEEHPMNNGEGGVWLRHMSMSSPRVGYAPLKEAIQWVMGQLGFTSPVEQCVTYPEDIGPKHIAINVLEEIKTTAEAGTA